MFRRILACGGILLLAGAVLFATPGAGWARGGGHGGGGGHFGGGHFGGAHFGGGHFGGGYHGGFYHGGYHPYYGYHHDYNGFYPYYGYGYYPYYDYLWSGGAADSGYADGYADVGPTYLEDVTSATPPAATYQSYYPPATGAGRPDTVAQVTVNVPPDARVWFEGKPTTSVGAVRQFDSPPLTPDTRYVYDIKANWNENGHQVTQAQQVQVTAGAHVNVRFPAPPKTTGQASAATHD